MVPQTATQLGVVFVGVGPLDTLLECWTDYPTPSGLDALGRPLTVHPQATYYTFTV